MSDVKQSYRIDGEGRFFRETVTSDEIEVTDSVARAFQQAQPLITLHNVAIINDHIVGVKYDPNTQLSYWSVNITSITLQTAFRPIGEGENATLVPKFVYDKNNKNEVVMSIPWLPAVGDAEGYAPRITLVVTVDAGLKCVRQYLFAFDRRDVAYRMPMSNLYNTCELCSGEFDRFGGSQLECVRKAVEQFHRGAWNSDLYTSSDEASQNFFRFKPLKEGFETLPITEKWTTWCEKVSTPTVKLAI